MKSKYRNMQKFSRVEILIGKSIYVILPPSKISKKKEDAGTKPK